MSAFFFDAEQVRLAAAAHLPPEQLAEFQRLAKSLIHGPAFQLLVVDCDDTGLRGQVLQALAQVQRSSGLRGANLWLNTALNDVQALETRLIRLAAEYQVIHILGARDWMDAGRWASLNLLRERLSVSAKVRLVFWLEASSIMAVVRHAPDLWAWRSGVYAFVMSLRSGEGGLVQGRLNRVALLSSWLDENSDLPGDMRAPLVDELIGLVVELRDDVPESRWDVLNHDLRVLLSILDDRSAERAAQAPRGPSVLK